MGRLASRRASGSRAEDLQRREKFAHRTGDLSGLEPARAGWRQWLRSEAFASWTIISSSSCQGPNWDFRTLNFDSDVALADKLDTGHNAMIGSEEFTSHGGKLIQYHGWNDQLIAPRTASTTTPARSRRWRDGEDRGVVSPVMARA